MILKGLGTPAAREVRRLLKAEAQRVPSFGGYAAARDAVADAIERGRAAGDVGVEQLELAGRLVALREIEAADKLDLLMKRAGREDALGRPR